MIYLYLYIVAAYFVLVFFGLRLFVPFMGFGKWLQPQNVPMDILTAVKAIEANAVDDRSYLEFAYKIILNKTQTQWHHTRFQAAFRINRLFVKDLNEIWNTNKFLYCSQINYLMFTLLVQSRYFKPEHIRVRHVFLNFVLHQYLQVKAAGTWVDVDPAGAGIRGKPLGQHAELFG